LIGVLFPYTLLWGETRVGALLMREPFDDALAPALNAWAVAGRCAAADEAYRGGGGAGSAMPVPCFLTPWSELLIGLTKLVVIAVAVGAGLPGGVIYPLFFAAAAIAKGSVGVCEQYGISLFGIHVPWLLAAAASSSGGHSGSNNDADGGGGGMLSGHDGGGGGGGDERHDNFGPVATVCLMAALQAATTRTPLATVFMLAMASAPAADNTAALLPAMATGAYVGVWTAQAFGVSFFEYPK
jgi:hypothetical protein